MKKILTLLLVLVLSLSVMVGCDKIPGLGDFELPDIGDLIGGEHEHNFVDGECECGEKDPNYTPAPETDADLKLAYDYVHQLIKTTPEKTVADYTLVLVAPVGEKNYTVTWEIIGTDKVTIDGETVKVPEAGDNDINYTLKFTVTNEKGETLSREYSHVVPKFAVNTYAEYAAAEEGAPLVVDGVVYGIMSKKNGDAENSVFVQDLNNAGGYYLYAVSDDVVAKAVIGQTVRVKGNKANYNGTLELKNATIEVLNTETTTVTPTDLTEVFTNATSAEDANLLATLGGYVTIKGVTILEAGDNGYYYFELDGVKTYLRISSSSNCSSADDEKTIKKNHSDKFYYAAEVTGIAAVYNKAFYIMPVDAKAFSNFSEEMQPMPDDVKAKFIVDKLGVTSEMVTTDPVTLPLLGTSVVNMSVFENVNIVWTLAETANATLANGVLTAVLPTEPGSVNISLTATVTVNNVTETKDFTVAVKNVAPISITEANTIASGKEHNTYTESGYVIEGIITEIANGKYGNIYVGDAAGNTIYVYGIYSVYGELRFDKLESAPKVGDKVVLYGILGQYNETNQMKNAWLLSWEHIHNYTEQGETVEPTCAQGYTVYSCYCGETEKRDFTDAVAEHECEQNFFWHPEMVQATCTAGGVAVFECINCDYYYTEETEIDPEGHNFLYGGAEEILTPANCATQTNGTKRVSCANGCGATQDQEIDYYWSHEWNVLADVEPTCTTDGDFHRVCTICNVEETEERLATGHWSFNDVKCGDTDTCAACNVEYVIEHNTNFTPATCTQAAYCVRCWSYVGEPLGHDWDENDPASVCSRCGLSNHTCNFVAGEVIAPTCTEDGYTIYGCDVHGCNATEKRDYVDALNHVGTETTTTTTPSTCKEYGSVVVTCSCGEVLSTTALTELAKHKDDDSDFLCDYECETVIEPADGTVLTIPQAAELGVLTTTTNKIVLSGVITGFYGSGGTTFGNVYIKDEAGNSILIYGLYSEDGSTRYDGLTVKPVKGDTITVYGVMTNYKGTAQMKDGWLKVHEVHEHNYESKVTAPTCTAAGYTTYTCTVCGGSYKEEGAAALGHTTDNGTCGNCGQVIGGEAPTVVVYNLVSTYDGTTYYFAGTVSSGAGAITENASEAVDVYKEDVDGGYYLYILDSTGAKQYINIGTASKSLSLTATPQLLKDYTGDGYTAIYDSVGGRGLANYKGNDLRTYAASSANNFNGTNGTPFLLVAA